uniref:BVpp66b protein n=1 Tax=Chelonus inanitus TaxID=49201 RepID=D7FB28_9HYME|nr:BVpp66b protein [Chelonus inanitus]
MPDNVPNLMNIDDQDSISKEYYETTLQLLGEKLKTIDKVNNYLIIHENDKLCKEYHALKKELDHREKQLFKTKEQVDQIENIRKVSGDNSTNIQKNLIKEREELKRIRHEINDKKSRVKKIQKLIRKLDKNDYDLQNDKHVLYNGMRKLIEHWLLQIQNELNQEINVERQIKLQDDIEKAKEKLALIVADINDMYLSYNKRKKNRMLTDFDYENFCEYSTFTECLLRYDTSSKNDNNNAMVAF